MLCNHWCTIKLLLLYYYYALQPLVYCGRGVAISLHHNYSTTRFLGVGSVNLKKLSFCRVKREETYSNPDCYCEGNKKALEATKCYVYLSINFFRLAPLAHAYNVART